MLPAISNAILAFGLWGISPLFWKQLKFLPATELIAWRILLTFISIFFILLFQKKIKLLSFKLIPIKQVLLASFLISSNWYLFIWAVNNDYVLQGSLGYFMGPIFSFFIGFVWLKEKVNWIQSISLLLFLIAILILTSKSGIPWVSLSLALTFAIYGLVKKQLKLIPQVSVFYETLFIVPLCIIFLILNDLSIGEMKGVTFIYFLFAGFFTYLPLHFFAKAAQEMPLTSLGVLQYIAPLGQFLIGRFWYQEPFENYQIWAYTLVWLGIIIFTSSAFIHRLKKQ